LDKNAIALAGVRKELARENKPVKIK